MIINAKSWEAKMTKSNYFAIDSDILRSLAFIDILFTNDPNCDLRTANDPLVKKWSGYLKKLYLKIKSNEVHPVIVEAVYLESKHSKSLLDFMRKYCYFPNVNAINYPQKREKAKRLANAYCMPYKFEGEAKSPSLVPPLENTFLQTTALLWHKQQLKEFLS